MFDGKSWAIFITLWYLLFWSIWTNMRLYTYQIIDNWVDVSFEYWFFLSQCWIGSSQEEKIWLTDVPEKIQFQTQCGIKEERKKIIKLKSSAHVHGNLILSFKFIAGSFALYILKRVSCRMFYFINYLTLRMKFNQKKKFIQKNFTVKKKENTFFYIFNGFIHKGCQFWNLDFDFWIFINLL